MYLYIAWYSYVYINTNRKLFICSSILRDITIWISKVAVQVCNSEECDSIPWARTSNNSRYIALPGHLLWLGKIFGGWIRTLTQPHNLLLTVCPSYCMYWNKGDTEIVGMAKQLLVQPDNHTTKVRPALTLSGAPGIRSWMVQSPRSEEHNWRKQWHCNDSNVILLYS